MSLFRKKSATCAVDESERLNACLTAKDLVLLGIGAIIGAGVFVLTGVAAATSAGPAVSLSYVFAGLASLFAALCYAELASSIGGCGSAYNYTYVGFGEFMAWIIGWDLLLEYSLSVSTVAIGWSGYVNNALLSLGIPLPTMLSTNPFQGGMVNAPAAMIIVLLAALLCVGVRQSAKFNAWIVAIKLMVIAFFIVVAIPNVKFAYWHPFAPFGFHGVVSGAALVFFAYIGFDAVSTAVEETIDPQKAMPIGIIVSVTVCTLIYILVAALLTGIVPYQSLNVASPVSDALMSLGYHTAGGVIALGAIAGLTSVMLVMYYGLTRIFFAMSRDGLLPSLFSVLSSRFKTPITVIILCGIVMATIAGLVPLAEAAELVNIGTLAAFIFVCAGVMYLRITQPDLERPFKLPFFPYIPLLGIIFCAYLMLHLSPVSWERFVIWLLAGVVIYFVYGIKKSKLRE